MFFLSRLFGEFTESFYFCITIYRIMKKTFVHWGGLFVVLMAFSSCFCPIVEFANQDCISITKQPSYVKEMETELCYFGSYKKEWFTYQFIATDSMMSVDRNQVQVFYQGNPLKFKLYRLSEDGWKETDAIEIKDSTLLKISIKDRLKEGESLQIVEKGLSVAGDSIVTSIRIPIIYNQTQRHVNKSSKLYQTFRPFKTWYF